MTKPLPNKYYAWIVGCAATLLYVLTCQRGAGWQDSAVFQFRILQGDYDGQAGIALAHRLYIGTCRVWLTMWDSFGWTRDVFFKINLLSALAMGIAVGLTWCVATLMTGRRSAGWVAAILLGFAHMPWWMATTTEVYAGGLAFHMAQWGILALLLLKNQKPEEPDRQRYALLWWTLLGVVNGVHMSWENFALLNLPAIGGVWIWAVMRRQIKWWSLGLIGAGWIAGAVMWWEPVLQSMMASGFVFGLKNGFFGLYCEDLVLGRVPFFTQLWAMNMGLFAFNFMNPLWFMAAWGGWKILRTRGWRRCCVARGGMGFAFGVLFLTHFIFFIRYPVGDQATFAIPCVALLALFGGAGVAVAIEHWKNHWTYALMLLGIAGPVCAYALLAWGAATAVAYGVLPPRGRELPFRNDFRFWAIPWKASENSAQKFIDALTVQFAEKPNCVMWADIMQQGVAMLTNLIRDSQYDPDATPDSLIVVTSFHTQTPPFEELAREGRFYVISPGGAYTTPEMMKQLDFVKDGMLWRGIPKAKNPAP